jgi:succinoglycan biosynthesis protein ExoV
VRLYYHKCPEPNFGDEINAWFWEKLFSQPLPNKKEELFVGIGTLLNDKLPDEKLVHIFGSGAGYGDKVIKTKNSWKVHCVRGPLTAKAIGVDKSLAIVDPAVLLPLIHPLEEKKTIDVAFMPHIGIDSSAYRTLIESMGITYLSPTEDPVTLLKKISQTKKLITSAMHGAIIADAYRVPWNAIVTSPEILPFKWLDWCATLNLEYSPTKVPSFWEFNNRNLIDFAKKQLKSIKIKSQIRTIANSDNFRLSQDHILESRQAQLLDKVEEFKNLYLEK